MPSILKTCKSLFHTEDLYKVLGVSKEASNQELKKGYHRRALAYHPDRADKDDKETATKRFQALGQVYSILTDEDRRKEYNDTGEVGEDHGADRDWGDYWRLLFPKVSQKDIEEYADKYRGSEEELNDLKQAYQDHEGDMEKILDTVLCCTFEDEPRFTDILTGLVNQGEVSDFDKFSKENKKSKKTRLRKAQSEAKEAEEEAKKLKLDEGQDSLFAAIAQRQASRAAGADDFLSKLEAKQNVQTTVSSEIEVDNKVMTSSSTSQVSTGTVDIEAENADDLKTKISEAFAPERQAFVKELNIRCVEYSDSIIGQLSHPMTNLTSLDLNWVNIVKLHLNEELTPNLISITIIHLPEDCDFKVVLPKLESVSIEFFNPRNSQGIHKMLAAATQLKYFGCHKLGVYPNLNFASNNLESIMISRADGLEKMSIWAPKLECLDLSCCYSIDNITMVKRHRQLSKELPRGFKHSKFEFSLTHCTLGPAARQALEESGRCDLPLPADGDWGKWADMCNM